MAQSGDGGRDPAVDHVINTSNTQFNDFVRLNQNVADRVRYSDRVNAVREAIDRTVEYVQTLNSGPPATESGVLGVGAQAIGVASAGLAAAAPVGVGGAATILLSTVALSSLQYIFDAAEEAARRRDRDRCDHDDQDDDELSDPPISPLTIDLDGDGVETTDLNGSNVFFDLDADGFAERTGWVSKDDGLLVLDRDTNGTIDNITELFGSSTRNGFSELAELDSNSDGLIDQNDAQFSELRIWRDLNGDGKPQNSELLTLSDLNIESVDAVGNEVDETNNGNPVPIRVRFLLLMDRPVKCLTSGFATPSRIHVY